MGQRILTIFLLFVLIGCQKNSPDLSDEPAPPIHKTQKILTPQKNIEQKLSSLIKFPFSVELNDSQVTVTLDELVLLGEADFTQTLFTLIPMVVDYSLLRHTLELKAMGEGGVKLSAHILSADAKAYQDGKISKPEMGRRMELVVVDTPQSLKTKAIALRKTFKNEEALALFVKWLDGDPQSPEPLSWIGNINRDLKKYPEAIEAYKKLQVIKGESVFTLWNLGYCSEQMGVYEDSRNYYQKALALDPKNQILTRQLILSFYKNAQTSQAIDLLQKAKTENTAADLFLLEGNMNRDAKKFKEAKKSYEDGLKLSMGDDRFLFNTVLVDLDLKDFDQAKKDFETLKQKKSPLTAELEGVFP